MTDMPDIAEPRKPRLRWYRIRGHAFQLMLVGIVAIVCILGVRYASDWAHRRDDEAMRKMLRQIGSLPEDLPMNQH